VNVGVSIGLTAVEGVLAARAALGDDVELQLVALVERPVAGADGAANRRLLREAMLAGVDVVGGCPHLDPDPVACLEHCVALAAELDRPLDLHMDEQLEPDAFHLPLMAALVAEAGLGGRAVASHSVSLVMQPEEVQRATAEALAAAGVAVVTLPHTNLYLQGRDHPVATPRGLTAVRPLLRAGVVLAAGADNLQDPFNPMGRADPLETAALLVMAGHLLPEEAYRAVSGASRTACRRAIPPSWWPYPPRRSGPPRRTSRAHDSWCTAAAAPGPRSRPAARNRAFTFESRSGRDRSSRFGGVMVTTTSAPTPSGAATGPAALAFTSLAMQFPDGTQALHDVSFTVSAGEFVTVVGPSGCGKSTLLRIASGLTPHSGGRVEVDRKRLGYVFQDATLLPWRNVRRNVELLAELEGIDRSQRDALARQAIELVGLSGFEDKYPKQLSGGMRMRASLARALVLSPKVFLFDEPFGALDEITRERLNDELLRLFQHEGFAALFITHSIQEAVFLSTRVLVMSPRPGRIVGDFAVPFPYPRESELRYAPEFAELAGQVSLALREAHA
jgi:NitT/TauT family transport system ATP-binding protein